MARFFRQFLRFCALLVIALAFVSVLIVTWLRTSLPEIDGTLALRGLGGPVEVIRDANGVPHIFADRVNDAYFGLGFTHAQDRLWQMEMTRRIGAGRLSEIFGNRTLKIDRFIRTLGLYRAAQAQLTLMKTDERALLDAYAAGVNALLNNHTGALSPEFAVLGHKPEPWRPEDSLVWARIMAVRLSGNWRSELLRLRLAETLTPVQIEQLWPSDDGTAPATLSSAPNPAAAMLDRLARALPDELAPIDASNAWVIGGSRTETGKPILANDPHLGFGVPILWYLARIETPNLSLTGATVPGVPLHPLGHNGKIAWGMTTTGADVEDLYIEALDPNNPEQYLTPDGPASFTTRVEKIYVTGDDPVTLTVRETRHGPVVSDVLDEADRSETALESVISLASPTTRIDDETARALYLLNRASNWGEFLDAARLFHAPVQNLFFADTAGDIGLVTPGRIPIRKDHDGARPVPGQDERFDWNGFIPFDELPKRHNPPNGLIINANNRLVGPDYPHSIAKHWQAAYRAARIVEALDGKKAHTAAESAALQMDTVSPAARRLVPLLLTAPAKSDKAKKAITLLRAWDFRMHRDRAEPLIYAAWLRALERAIVQDELGDRAEDYTRSRARFVIAALTENQSWCDDVTTAEPEACDTQIAGALETALADIAKSQGPDIDGWRWGAAHKAQFRHRIFTQIPGLRSFTDLVVETDGGDHTLNRGQTRQGGPTPFSHVHGSGYRAVYDLGDLDRSRYIIATGQSGNPFSPHYGDMLDRWRAGEFVTIGGNREDVRRQAANTLTLMPSRTP